MAVRTARTAWNGGLTDGSGQVELSSSRIGTYDGSWPRRTSEAADGVTSPEELVAAGAAFWAVSHYDLVARAREALGV